MLVEIIPSSITLVLAAFVQYFFGITMTLTALFLILLVLVQRGRGGGLAGAFGGMGGQSAFGTKAGDAFTKITIGASVFWLLLCIASVRLLGPTPGAFGEATRPSQTQLAPGAPGADEPLLPNVPSDAGQPAAEGGGLGGATAPADSGSTDGGSTDGGSTDGGSTDGGSTDGGSTDGGSTDVQAEVGPGDLADPATDSPAE